MNARRLFELDIARALCIVLVVVGHFAPEQSPNFFVIIRQWIYSFHMPVFFIISGYVWFRFRPDELSYAALVKRKFQRLMLPYFFASFAIIVIKLLTQGNMSVNNPVNIYSFLHLFWKPEAGYFLWFVWTLFSLFLVVPLFRTRKHRLFLFAIMLLVHYIIVVCNIDVSRFDVFAVGQTYRMAHWFLLGVILAEYGIGLKRSRIVSLLCLCSFILCSLWFAFYPAYDEQSVPALLLPYLGITSVLGISSFLTIHFDIVRPVLLMVGQSSFFIYLFHTTCMGFAKSLSLQYGCFLTPSGFWLQWGCVVAFGLLVPFVGHRILIRYCPALKRYC